MKIMGILLIIVGGLWCVASIRTSVTTVLIPTRAKRTHRAHFPNEDPNVFRPLEVGWVRRRFWTAVWMCLAELGNSLLLLVSGVLFVTGCRCAIWLAIAAVVLYVMLFVLGRWLPSRME